MILITNKQQMTKQELQRKIARQQAQHDRLFKAATPTTIKKCTRLTFARNTLYKHLDHSRVYYTHVKL